MACAHDIDLKEIVDAWQVTWEINVPYIEKVQKKGLKYAQYFNESLNWHQEVA